MSLLCAFFCYESGFFFCFVLVLGFFVNELSSNWGQAAAWKLAAASSSLLLDVLCRGGALGQRHVSKASLLSAYLDLRSVRRSVTSFALWARSVLQRLVCLRQSGFPASSWLSREDGGTREHCSPFFYQKMEWRSYWTACAANSFAKQDGTFLRGRKVFCCSVLNLHPSHNLCKK